MCPTVWHRSEAQGGGGSSVPSSRSVAGIAYLMRRLEVAHPHRRLGHPHPTSQLSRCCHRWPRSCCARRSHSCTVCTLVRINWDGLLLTIAATIAVPFNAHARPLEPYSSLACKLVEINHLEAAIVRLVQKCKMNLWIQRNYSAKLIPAGLRGCLILTPSDPGAADITVTRVFYWNFLPLFPTADTRRKWYSCTIHRSSSTYRYVVGNSRVRYVRSGSC